MSGPRPWSLGDEPPAPMTWEEAEEAGAAVSSAATHTGTDPLGRAIGPAEDHTKVKAVLDADGKEVTPQAPRAQTKKASRARR